MKQKALVRLLLLLMMQQLSQFVTAQNVGIGTNAPTGPLSFANTLGNKLVLWGNGNNAHYGIGVQSGLLQVYADAASANIGFGYGSSSSFNERMRILNNGNYDGMLLNGRLLIKNGSNDPIGGGGGVWLYKADNSALLGFMGTQNNQNIGFYGGPGGWGFTYDAINSRVGIGNPNPNAPLAFAAVGGKKIVLYPGTVGDAGFGIASNRLQIFSDNPNADVAIGYDAAGVFNERFAVKPNGAIAFSGNTGLSGQVLSSNGGAASPQWRSLSDVIEPLTDYVAAGQDYYLNDNNIGTYGPLNFNMPANARLLLWSKISTFKLCTIGPCHSAWIAKIYIDGTLVDTYEIQGTSWAQQYRDNKSVGPTILSITPGAHALTFTVQNNFGNPVAAVYPQLIMLPN